MQIQSPFQQLNDSDGLPLDGGYIYIGTVNLNPETSPITVYWDEALTLPAAQPIRTTNGFISRSGTPSRVFTSLDDYSITCKNSNGEIIYSLLDATSLSSLQSQLASSSGSSLVGFIQAGTGALASTVETKLRESVSVKDFGAVVDGADTGAAFTGTDNTAFFQAALDYCGLNRKALYIPSGKYRFAQLAAGTASLNLTYDNYSVFGDGYATTELLVDESTATLAGNEDFIRGSNLGTSDDRTLRGILEFSGFAIRGRWTHSPKQNGGTHFLTVENFSEVILHDFAAYDCRGKFSRSGIIDKVRVHNCTFERIGSDCLRFIDSNNAAIHNNTFKWIDDDVIALHTETNATYPPAERYTVTGNNFFQCEGVTLLGARNTVAVGNNFKFSKSVAMYIGGVVSTEGDNESHSIIVSNNSVVDTLMRYDDVTNALLTQSATNCAIIVASQGMSLLTTASAYPGRPITAGTSFTDPLGIDSNSKFLMNNSTSGTNSIPAGINVIVSNNSIIRTLPATAAFTNYGFGRMFSGNDGWVDPAVALTQTTTNGIGLIADMRNAIVTGNTISGYRNGAGVNLIVSVDTPDNNFAFDNILITGNSISDVLFGVRHSATANGTVTLFTWGVMVTNNIIDCDTYHQSASRTAPLDGTWASGGVIGTRPSCVFHRRSNGWIISNNKFSNAYDAILGDVDDSKLVARHNTLICDPAVVGYSVTNKGIGDIGHGGDKYLHQVTMCDPRTQTSRSLTLTRSSLTVTATSVAHGIAIGTSIIVAGAAQVGYNGQYFVETTPTADTFTYTITSIPATPATGTITGVPVSYGKLIYSPLIESTTIPTIGKYVTGHFVRNAAPTTASSKTTIGWIRQSVSTLHVAATTTTADWAAVVATTS